MFKSKTLKTVNACHLHNGTEQDPLTLSNILWREGIFLGAIIERWIPFWNKVWTSRVTKSSIGSKSLFSILFRREYLYKHWHLPDLKLLLDSFYTSLSISSIITQYMKKKKWKQALEKKTIKPHCCLLLSPFYALRAHKTIFFLFFCLRYRVKQWQHFSFGLKP